MARDIFIRAVVLTLLLLTLTACKQTSSYNVENLIEDLRTAGLDVETTDEPTDTHWIAPGRTMLVDGETLYIHELPDTDAADEKASYISKDGLFIEQPVRDQEGWTKVILRNEYDWLCRPHFYKRGRIIVIYAGDNPAILGRLRELLGEQFAGARPADRP